MDVFSQGEKQRIKMLEVNQEKIFFKGVRCGTFMSSENIGNLISLSTIWLLALVKTVYPVSACLYLITLNKDEFSSSNCHGSKAFIHKNEEEERKGREGFSKRNRLETLSKKMGKESDT